MVSPRTWLARCVWAVVALALTGCGAGLQSATFGAAAPKPNDPYLVAVVDAEPKGAFEVVTLSVAERRLQKALPARLDDDAVLEMRKAAAARGATVLLVERLDTPWRKAFYGQGMRPAKVPRKPLPACTHETALAEARDVANTVQRCLAGEKRKRPALKGGMTILFEVDPFGRERRALPSPDSSRDSLVRRCGLKAVQRAEFGTHAGVGCRLNVSATL